jgi:serine/threonine-protein kinase
MSSDDASIIGRTLAGRFRVTAYIGEGGMASVYRAEQDAEPRDVAVKILHPHLVSDATFVGRFRREARAAAKVVHPSSVRILDTGVDGQLLYIAMELLGGQDLFEILVLERRLAEARAVSIVADVADALAAAHARGVIHRDLKPENIMLVPDPADPSRETVKVLDFGIAKILERDVKASSDGLPSMYPALTGVDTVVGTPAYMSPEQCRGEAVDHTSDIYACGVLLYQLVTGRLPFTAASTMDIAVMHVRTPPAPLGSLVPLVHPRLAAAVDKALAKWPAQRQQSAVELRDELRAILPNASMAPLEVLDAPAFSAAPEAASHDRDEGDDGDDRRATKAAPAVERAVSVDRETLPFVASPEPAHVARIGGRPPLAPFLILVVLALMLAAFLILRR